MILGDAPLTCGNALSLVPLHPPLSTVSYIQEPVFPSKQCPMHPPRGKYIPSKAVFQYPNPFLANLFKTTCPTPLNLSGSQQYDMLILQSISTKALMNNDGKSFSEKHLLSNFSLQYLNLKQGRSGKEEAPPQVRISRHQ